MREEWKDIVGFTGYQISSHGRVRTFWRKKHYPTGYGTYRYLSDIPTIMRASDDGNGYLKVMLYNKVDGRRYCKKIHRLVAEAFIPNVIEGYTVDHIRSGYDEKKNNNVGNLRWISRADNIKKAYADGVCDERIRRQKRPIVATDLWTDEEYFFSSIGEAADSLNIDRTSISHVLRGDHERTGHYAFEYAEREDILLHAHCDY